MPNSNRRFSHHATRRVAAVSLSLAALGCSHAPVVYPPVKPHYYSLSYETNRNADLGALPRTSQPLAVDAKHVLRRGQRVAFLPPDSCTTDTVSPSGAEDKGTSMLMRCGALVASLEAEVAKAGYSVVSWQALKSSGSSLDRARSLQVDVLFEVNQLSHDVRRAGQSGISNMRFASHTGPDGESPIAVGRPVAQRCGDQLLGLVPPGTEFLSTVNLKATEVATGRALWLYQNTVVELVGGETSSSVRTRYYLAKGERPPPPPFELSAAHTPGVLLTGLGAGALTVGLLFETTDDGAFEPHVPSLLGWGTLSLVGGVGLLILDHMLTAPSYEVPNATYPEPAEVLCVASPIEDPWAAPREARVEAPAESFNFDVKRAAAPGRDEERERSERLTRKSAEDFVAALVEVASRAP